MIAESLSDILPDLSRINTTSTGLTGGTPVISRVTSYVRQPSHASAVLFTDTLPGTLVVRSILLTGIKGIGNVLEMYDFETGSAIVGSKVSSSSSVSSSDSISPCGSGLTSGCGCGSGSSGDVRGG